MTSDSKYATDTLYMPVHGQKLNPTQILTLNNNQVSSEVTSATSLSLRSIVISANAMIAVSIAVLMEYSISDTLARTFEKFDLDPYHASWIKTILIMVLGIVATILLNRASVYFAKGV